MAYKHISAKTGHVEWLEDDPATEFVPPPPTADEIRNQRNQLLAASDWTQVPDAPVDQAAWAIYRQALRALPQQAGFPEDVNWPESPNE